MESQKIATFEIEQPSTEQETSIERPLDEDNAIQVPIPILTKGLKPEIVRYRSSMALICIPLAFFFLVSILCYIQVRITNSADFAEFMVLKSVFTNLLDTTCIHRPILSVRLVEAGEGCPAEHISIPAGYWYGTKDGCYEPSTKRLQAGSCQPLSGFHTVPQIRPQSMRFWRRNSLCVQYLWNYTVPPNYDRNFCPANTKFCKSSPGGICVNVKYPCPIDQVKIFPKALMTENFFAGKNYTEHIFGNYKLSYSNDENSSRKLTGFSTSITDKPCLDRSQSPKHRNLLKYPLLEQDENGCSVYGVDLDTTIIDSYEETQYHKDNSIYGAVQSLPLSNQYFSESDKIVLVAEYMKGVRDAPECDLCHSDNNKELKKVVDHLLTTSKFYKIFSIFAIGMIGVMVLTSLYNIITYIRCGGDPKKVYEKLGNTNILIFVYLLGYFLTSGLLSLLNFVETRKSINDLDDIAHIECFKNPMINTALIDLHEKALLVGWKMAQDSGLTIIVGILANIGVMLAEYLLVNTRKKGSTENERDSANSAEIEPLSREVDPQ